MTALIAAIAVAIWVATGIILAGRGEQPLPAGWQNIFLKNCRIHGNRINTRSWSFSCAKAQMSPDGTFATIDGVRDGILYKHGKPYLRISAQHASVNTQTFDFTATGDVHIEALNAKDGIQKSFDTDLVQWTNATKMLMLPHQSLVRTGEETLKVASITVNFNNNEVHLGKIDGAFIAPGP
jgi:hypothetical protein